MADLYSANKSLPEPTRLMMRALEAAHGDRFQTSFYLKDKESGTQTVAWREAWRNPVTCKWEVTEHATLMDFYPGQEGEKDSCAERRQTLHNNLCFFDALYHCALFEVSERKFGHDRAARSYATGQTHYTVFAEREGVPFDKTGMPLLAAYGRILSDGDYDGKAHEIAERSPATLEFEKAPDVSLFNSSALSVSTLPAANLPAVIAQGGSIEEQRLSLQEKQQAQLQSHKAMQKMQVLIKKVERVSDALLQCRVGGFHNHYVSPFLFPLIPIVGQLMLAAAIIRPDLAYREILPRTAFFGSVKKLKAEYNKLSGVIDIAPLEQYTQDALMTYQAMAARQAASAYVRGKGSEKKVKQWMEEFRTAASGQGWDESKIEGLLEVISTDLEDDEFNQRLMDKFTENKKKLVAYLKASSEKLVQKRLAAP